MQTLPVDIRLQGCFFFFPQRYAIYSNVTIFFLYLWLKIKKKQYLCVTINKILKNEPS